VAESNPAYLEVSYHYDGAGRLEDRILSNGAHTRYVWDIGGRLTQLLNTTITGQLVNNTRYTRDRIGNILTQIETGQTVGTGFSYDPEYRLLSADYIGTANDEAYSYDKVGNRLISTQGALIPIASSRYYNYNAGNRMTDIRIGSTTGTLFESYAYDDNGSMTGISGNRNLTLTWDLNNRVSQINTNTFNYDPSNYRIKKSGSAINNYYLEGENLEAVYNEKGIVQAQYLRGSVIDEIVNGYQLDATGKMVNTTYHHDALQSVLGQSGHEGSILASQSYSSFGSTLSQTGTSNNAQKYTGREQDAETGFYYYRARYYDAVTGRFISEDPKGFGAGVNFYAYVNNNPVNGNDPTGFINYGDAFSSGLGILSSGAGAVVGVTGILSGGALLAADNPLATIAGIGSISYSSVLLANSSGNFVLSAQNLFSALMDQPAGVPASLAEGFAGIIAPGSVNAQLAATAFNLTLDFASGRVPVGLIPTDVGSALSGFKFANFSELNNYNTSVNAIGDLPISMGMAGIAASTLFSDVLQFSSTLQTGLSIAPTISDNLMDFADGGFVLYPNKSNTSQTRSVYSKLSRY
jgi:RHS repeat-associated protein